MGQRNIKAQSSFEFMVMIGIQLFLFITILAIGGHRFVLRKAVRDEIIARDFLVFIQKEINMASRVADGYQRQFVLTETLENKPYVLRSISNEISITYSGNDYSITLPSYQGNITKGQNIIMKKQGVVYVNY